MRFPHPLNLADHCLVLIYAKSRPLLNHPMNFPPTCRKHERQFQKWHLSLFPRKTLALFLNYNFWQMVNLHVVFFAFDPSLRPLHVPLVCAIAFSLKLPPNRIPDHPLLNPGGPKTLHPMSRSNRTLRAPPRYRTTLARDQLCGSCGYQVQSALTPHTCPPD